jgi:hypothetical protein
MDKYKLAQALENAKKRGVSTIYVENPGTSNIQSTSTNVSSIPELPKLDEVTLEEPEIIDFPFKKMEREHVDLVGTKRQARRTAEEFAKDHPGFNSYW